VLGLARRGFFIPYRYAAELPAAGTRPPYPAVEALFAEGRSRFAALLAAMDRRRDALLAIGANQPPQPRWDQLWFPRLDAAAAYVMLRETPPARVVEVGSGHSTRFFARACADGALDTRIIAIDPAPRAVLGGLPIDFRRSTLQRVGDEVFAGLTGGDVVSIDSSHILMPGSDLDMFFGRVLPLLPVGCRLHIHDIFLPDDYPAAWDWRGYNEQLAVLPLLFGGGWEVLWSSHFVATRMASALTESVAGTLPLPEGAIESSLWLRKTDGNAGLTVN
jgi:hypothetical protein